MVLFGRTFSGMYEYFQKSEKNNLSSWIDILTHVKFEANVEF